MGTCPSIATQAFLMEKLQPGMSVFTTAPPPWAWTLPGILLSDSPGPSGTNKSLHSSWAAPFCVAFAIYSRPSPPSLPSLAPAPKGRLQPPAFDSLSTASSMSSLTSQMSECQPDSLRTANEKCLVPETEVEMSMPWCISQSYIYEWALDPSAYKGDAKED